MVTVSHNRKLSVARGSIFATKRGFKEQIPAYPIFLSTHSLTLYLNSIPLDLTFPVHPCSHRVLGTPNEDVWPGVSALPDYKPTFPQWSPQSLAQYIPNLDAAGVDLLYVSGCLLHVTFHVASLVARSYKTTLGL